MSDFNLEVRKEGEIVVIKTSGYLNNVGGEKISEVCYKEIEDNGINDKIKKSANQLWAKELNKIFLEILNNML